MGYACKQSIVESPPSHLVVNWPPMQVKPLASAFLTYHKWKMVQAVASAQELVKIGDHPGGATGEGRILGRRHSLTGSRLSSRTWDAQ